MILYLLHFDPVRHSIIWIRAEWVWRYLPAGSYAVNAPIDNCGLVFFYYERHFNHHNGHFVDEFQVFFYNFDSLIRRIWCSGRELPDFVSDNGKNSPILTGSCCFGYGVDRQSIHSIRGHWNLGNHALSAFRSVYLLEPSLFGVYFIQYEGRNVWFPLVMLRSILWLIQDLCIFIIWI